MKREAPMNIPEFAAVLTAVMRHNMRLHDEGASIKDYLVPMAWGDPGLGKSDIAEAVADDLGWEMVYADLATRDPADLGGMPWITDGRTMRCRPDWLPTEGRGILFLDELPQAGLANLNIAATLIREHRIGEHRLPPTWMVTCAGNYQHNRAGTTTMPSHVRNRLLHLDINADANAWAKWASARGINPMLDRLQPLSRTGIPPQVLARPTTPTRRHEAGRPATRCCGSTCRRRSNANAPAA